MSKHGVAKSKEGRWREEWGCCNDSGFRVGDGGREDESGKWWKVGGNIIDGINLEIKSNIMSLTMH